MYDFTHPLSDSKEKITHSICTLEFEDHRPLYDWLLDELDLYHPQQIEFAKLKLEYVIMGKRYLRQLVEEKRVSGWDDPRLHTLRGLRRRGYPPEAIRDFCERVGVTKKNSTIQMETLENVVREHLDQSAHRAKVVAKPIKVIIENYPENQTEELEAKVHPKQPELGTRKLPFCREIFIFKQFLANFH